MADEKPTVELEKPPAWAIAMAENQARGFSELRADIGLVASDLSVVKGRVGILEDARRADEARAAIHSERVRGVSENDLETQKRLADEILARQAVDAKADKIAEKVEAVTEKVDTLDKKTDAQTVMLMKAANVFKDPRVLAAIYVVYTILKGWAERKGYL